MKFQKKKRQKKAAYNVVGAELVLFERAVILLVYTDELRKRVIFLGHSLPLCLRMSVRLVQQPHILHLDVVKTVVKTVVRQ